MSESLAKVYLDGDGNLLLEDFYLEKITQKEINLESNTSEDAITKLLEKVSENKELKSEVQKLKNF